MNLLVGQPVKLGWNWCKANGGSSGDEGRIEAIGYDWVVIRTQDGGLSMGWLEPSQESYEKLAEIQS